jgi:uncharacterized protein YifE (UPF0438 family)
MRTQRIEGKQPTNKERREALAALEAAEAARWTIDRLWKEYRSQKPDTKTFHVDEDKYNK